MPRIAPLDPPFDPSIQRRLDALMPPGMEPLLLFRTAAHNPRVLRSMQKGGLLDPGSVSVRTREIAILRTCALCDAEYEWGVHVRLFSEAAALDPEDLTALRSGVPSPGMTQADRAVLAACDALHRTSSLDDDAYGALQTHFDPAQILEITMLAGLYHAVAYLVNVGRIDLEPWAGGW